jgi:quercetin dioxygenase-like cupin family protein
MSDPIQPKGSHPACMTIRRAGKAGFMTPNTIATGLFWAETLLESACEGENTVIKANVLPGIITHWHSHPRGQFLLVLDGVGLVQSRGGAVEEVRAGDSIWFAPDEQHWHGAAAHSCFTYISVQAVKDSKTSDWFEPVAHQGDAA